MNLPEGRLGGLLALLLLLLVGAVIYGGVITPLRQSLLSGADQLEIDRLRLDRYRALAAELPALRSAWDAAGAPEASSGWALPDTDRVVATARLLGLVKEAVQRTNARIGTAESIPADSEAEAASSREVGVRLSVSGELGDCTAVLRELQAAGPVLRVDNLALRSEERGGADSGEPGMLTMTLDVFGYIA